MLSYLNTPFGRHRFVRMLFGTVSASDILHKSTYKTLDDIPSVHVVVNEMLIVAIDKSEHDRVLRKILDRARKQGVKFNLSKHN